MSIKKMMKAASKAVSELEAIQHRLDDVMGEFQEWIEERDHKSDGEWLSTDAGISATAQLESLEQAISEIENAATTLAEAAEEQS